ncbi:MAG: hypothetical protein P9M03_07175 [Candidatus Theseobacter exili]|nr:hypothetical protein [Candidatus Theseobacter exili]
MKFPEKSLKPNRSELGILLIEVLIAVSVLVIGLSVIARSFTTSLFAYKAAEKRCLAIELLQNLSNEIISREFLEDCEEKGQFKPPFQEYEWYVKISIHAEWSDSSPEDESDKSNNEEDDSAPPQFDSFEPFSESEEKSEEEDEADFILYKVMSRISWKERGKKVSIQMQCFSEKDLSSIADSSEDTETNTSEKDRE